MSETENVNQVQRSGSQEIGMSSGLDKSCNRNTLRNSKNFQKLKLEAAVDELELETYGDRLIWKPTPSSWHFALNPVFLKATRALLIQALPNVIGGVIFLTPFLVFTFFIGTLRDPVLLGGMGLGVTITLCFCLLIGMGCNQCLMMLVSQSRGLA